MLSLKLSEYSENCLLGLMRVVSPFFPPNTFSNALELLLKKYRYPKTVADGFVVKAIVLPWVHCTVHSESGEKNTCELRFPFGSAIDPVVSPVTPVR